MNHYGDPAGARVSLIFIPGAFAARLIYDAAAAAKKRKSTLPVFTCFRETALTRFLATHLAIPLKKAGCPYALMNSEREGRRFQCNDSTDVSATVIWRKHSVAEEGSVMGKFTP
jgi:hypothetical protein